MKLQTVRIVLACMSLVSCKNKNLLTHNDWFYLTGRYIGKEACTGNEATDYHLIEIIAPQKMGDSIVFDGQHYANVLKAKNINEEFQQPGTMIGFDARISSQRISSSTCTIDSAATFSLYEMLIIDQIPFR